MDIHHNVSTSLKQPSIHVRFHCRILGVAKPNKGLLNTVVRPIPVFIQQPTAISHQGPLQPIKDRLHPLPMLLIARLLF